MAFMVDHSLEGLRELTEGCDTHRDNVLQAKEAGQNLPKDEAPGTEWVEGRGVSNMKLLLSLPCGDRGHYLPTVHM